MPVVDRFGLSVLEVHTLAVIPVLKEKRPLFPAWLLSLIERWASDRALVARFANTKIYVLGLDDPACAPSDEYRQAR